MYGRAMGMTVVGVGGRPVTVDAAGGARCGAVGGPEANAGEAAQVGGIDIVPVPTLERVVAYLRGVWQPSDVPPSSVDGWQAPDADLADIRGQLQARRALEVAAAG